MTYINKHDPAILQVIANLEKAPLGSANAESTDFTVKIPEKHDTATRVAELQGNYPGIIFSRLSINGA